MNKTTRRVKALLTAVALGVCCAYAQTATPGSFVLPDAAEQSTNTGQEYYNLPVYTIDGISYALYTDESQRPLLSFDGNFGATVVPNTDKDKKYSGKIVIPEKVVIEGHEYPVVGFVNLSETHENESEDLEITLPNTIRVIGITMGLGGIKIKSLNIPESVRFIASMGYTLPELTIPGSVKQIGYQAFVWADNLSIEDGVEHCSGYSLGCNNAVLTVPGTIKLGYSSLYADNLKHLIIKKSANKDASPEFSDGFCDSSYEIMAITCEYENPPKAHKDAFRLEKWPDDPLYPNDNPDDPNVYDYHPTMCDRATLYVPRTAIEAYKSDPVWGQFERIRAIEDGIQDTSFYGLPTYTVGNLRYAVNETVRDNYNASIYKYTGAIVIPNDDKDVKYSGKVTVPEKVTINGTEYPVFGFMWLSEYPENESSDLEISLPEGLKVIGFNRNYGGSHNTIKAINIPKTVEYIGAMKYVVPGATVTLPGTIKVVSAAAGIEAEKLVIEDGAQVLGTQILGKTLITCHNTELTIPGSVQLGMLAIDARELESLKITKSKINGASPYLGSAICPNSPSIKKITCEYTVPPETSGGAFGLYHGYDMYERATLYVPEEAIEAYKTAPEWKEFKKILPIKDGVNDVTTDDAQVVATEYHDLAGRRLEAPAERGITIRTDVYSDGTRRCTKMLQ